MIILAVDTSSITATIALAQEGVLLGEMTLNNPKTHSQKLMPMIEHLFNQLNLKVKDIDLILASTGPGSFTGIRIGLSSVKAMAQVHRIPLVLISSLDMLSCQPFVIDGCVCTMIDAKKKDVFYGIYQYADGKVAQCEKDKVDTIDQVIDQVKNDPANNHPGKIYFVGDGAIKYRALIESEVENAVFLPFVNQLPKAGALIRYYELNKDDLKEVSYKEVHANYLRKSQAEIDLIKKKKKEKSI